MSTAAGNQVTPTFPVKIAPIFPGDCYSTPDLIDRYHEGERQFAVVDARGVVYGLKPTKPLADAVARMLRQAARAS